MEPYPSKNETAAYIARHLHEANESARKLIATYGADFDSFLFRRGLDEFLRREVVPLLARSPEEYVGFLDIDHWNQKHSFNFPGCVIDTGAVEVLDSYSCNGNDHWTYKGCKEWWGTRFDLIEQLNDPEIERINGKYRARLYIDYLSSTAEMDLKRYCYFLENGRFPKLEDLLPAL